MSAQIPDSMLLSDLLKAIGYDCPSTLQGKTFAEATSGSGTTTQTKTVTIVTNTSTEVTPDSGKLLSKVTVTTAVPNKLFAWQTSGDTVSTAFTLSATPSVGDDVYISGADGLTKLAVKDVGDTSIEVTISDVDTTFVRYLAGDTQF